MGKTRLTILNKGLEPSPDRLSTWFRKGIGIERKGDEMLKGKGIPSEAPYGVNKEG